MWRKSNGPIHRFISFALVCFLISSGIPVSATQAQGVMPLVLPQPGVMVHLSSEFVPAHLVGMTIHPDNALQFNFLVNPGNEVLDSSEKRREYKNLVKYFLASLTIPDQDQWVNLSPYEKNRIIADDFGKTEMGRNLLTQDYLLKQITSSLMYPESALGKKFWTRIYQRAWQDFHTTQVPVNTFNKVWIVPDQAIVYESGNSAYILKSHLKVMLEEDYLALRHSEERSNEESQKMRSFTDAQDDKTHTLASRIIRQVILPELQKEVNEGKNFALLRQIYSGMILATWYKKTLKKSFLGQIYADQSKVKGVDQDPKANQAIYQRYLRAFKKGVYNYIKEDVDKYTHEVIPRKYFSGGFTRNNDKAMTIVNDQTIGLWAKNIDPASLAVVGDGLDYVDIDLQTIVSQAWANFQFESTASVLGQKYKHIKGWVERLKDYVYAIDSENPIDIHSLTKNESVRISVQWMVNSMVEKEGLRKYLAMAVNNDLARFLKESNHARPVSTPETLSAELNLTMATVELIQKEVMLDLYKNTRNFPESRRAQEVKKIDAFSRKLNALRAQLNILEQKVSLAMDHQSLHGTVIDDQRLKGWQAALRLREKDLDHLSIPQDERARLAEVYRLKEAIADDQIALKYWEQQPDDDPIKNDMVKLLGNHIWVNQMGLEKLYRSGDDAMVSAKILRVWNFNRSWRRQGVEVFNPLQGKLEDNPDKFILQGNNMEHLENAMKVIASEYPYKPSTDIHAIGLPGQERYRVGFVRNRPAVETDLQAFAVDYLKKLAHSSSDLDNRVLLVLGYLEKKQPSPGEINKILSFVNELTTQMRNKPGEEYLVAELTQAGMQRLGDEVNYFVGAAYATKTPKVFAGLVAKIYWTFQHQQVSDVVGFGEAFNLLLPLPKSKNETSELGIIITDGSGDYRYYHVKRYSSGIYDFSANEGFINPEEEFSIKKPFAIRIHFNANGLIIINRGIEPLTIKVDRAMISGLANNAHNPFGGIDFNSANLDLQIKRNAQGVPLPLAQQDMTQLKNIQGFVPVIIDIKHINGLLPVFAKIQSALSGKVST